MQKPEFENNGKDFWVVFRKDIYNETSLKKLGINERQIKAVLYTKKNGKITNSIYQEVCDVSKATATRDLKDLIEDKNLLERIGDVGKGTAYILIGS